MALETVFDAVAERMGNAISFGGPDEVDYEAKPPRVTWEPLRAGFSPARRLRGGPGDDGAIKTREWLVRVTLWGEDFAATEQLVDQFLATLHDLLTLHSYEPTEEVWDTGEATDKGTLCVLTLKVLTPVLRTAHETRPISAINPTYSLNTE